jgi:hypothetical protein
MATFEVKSARLIGFEKTKYVTPGGDASIFLGTVGGLGLLRYDVQLASFKKDKGVVLAFKRYFWQPQTYTLDKLSSKAILDNKHRETKISSPNFLDSLIGIPGFVLDLIGFPILGVPRIKVNLT